MTAELRKNIQTTFYIVAIPIGIVIILYFAGGILKWFLLATIIAMLLNPLYDRLLDWGINRYISITLTIFVFVLAVAVVQGLLWWQVMGLTDKSEEIKSNVENIWVESQSYLSNTFNISEETVTKQAKNQLKNAASFAKKMFGSILSGLSNSLLLVVYLFVMLLQRNRFENFIYKVFPTDKQEEAHSLVDHIQGIAANYMVGKLIVMLCLGIMYALGFWAGGVQNFIFIALIGALLSIIPYVGNIIAGFLAIVLSVISGGGFNEVMIVIGVISLAQILESYILEPIIVGDRLSLNPFWVILGIVSFGLLWGMIGAIIALPLVSIIKLIFDHFPRLAPLGYVMGQREQRENPESEIGDD